jgi:hypothetical protein
MTQEEINANLALQDTVNYLVEKINKTPYINPSGKIRGLLSEALNSGHWQSVGLALTVLDACDEHDDKRLAERDALKDEVVRLGGVVDRLHGVLRRMSHRHDEEIAKKDELISQLQGTIDALRADLYDRDDRGQM